MGLEEINRDTRPSAAEEKARLALQLGELIKRIPASVRDGSIQGVRDWQQARRAAAKVAGSKRASVHELTSAISYMRRWS